MTTGLLKMSKISTRTRKIRIFYVTFSFIFLISCFIWVFVYSNFDLLYFLKVCLSRPKRILTAILAMLVGAFLINRFFREIRNSLSRYNILIVAANVCIGIATIFFAYLFYYSLNHVKLQGYFDNRKIVPLFNISSDKDGTSFDKFLVPYFMKRKSPVLRDSSYTWSYSYGARYDFDGAIKRVNAFMEGDPEILALKSSIRSDTNRPFDFETIVWKSNERSTHNIVLTRQLYLWDFMAAYKKTGELKYLSVSKYLMMKWLYTVKRYPESRSYDWVEDVVSGRIEAHMALMEILRSLKMISRDEELLFIRSLIHHLDYLRDDKRYVSGSNHGLYENCALLSIALRYPELNDSEKIKDLAIKRMEDQIDKNVSGMGVDLELSPFYQRVVMERYLWFYLVCRETGIKLSDKYIERLRRMFGYAAYILYPDNTIPAFGDSDPGKMSYEGWPLDLVKEWSEVQELTCVNLNKCNWSPPDFRSKLWGESGFAVIRNQKRSGDDLMLIMDAGPWPRGHQHYDALSICMFVNGMSLLEGPGYPSYHDPNRKRIIGTTAHNTVSVDLKDQSRGGSQVLNFTPEFTIKNGVEVTNFAFIRAKHNLYEGVIHYRNIFYLFPSSILIIDQLISSKEHDYRQHFHFNHKLIGKFEMGDSQRKMTTCHIGNDTGKSIALEAFSVTDGKPPVRLIPEVLVDKVSLTVHPDIVYFSRGRNLTFVTLFELNYSKNNPVEFTLEGGKVEFKNHNRKITIDLDNDGGLRYFKSLI